MKKKLVSNIPLKMMSLAVAILVWLLVVNVDNPMITRYISDVPVRVFNEAYIESGGKMCLIEESESTITVSVTGKRKTVERLTAGDIVATADLKQMISLNTNPVMVPISVSCTGINQGDIQAVPRNMSITLEEMMSQEFIISVDAGNSQPGVGYEIGEVQTTPEKIEITGPQSLIQKIDRVVAEVDVTGLVRDTTVRADLKIYDKNQDELFSGQVRYLKFDIIEPSVDVMVDLWKVRENVDLVASYVGVPANGYKVDNLLSTPSALKVAGTDEALQQLTENGNKIELPASEIDVSGASEDFETKVNIAKLLPEGLKLTTGSSDTVIVRASILPLRSQEYQIPTKNIMIQNVPSGMEAVCETEKVVIRVQGNQSPLAELTENMINLSIDLVGKTEGSYEVPVNVTLPAGYETVAAVKVTVKISELTDASNAENE